MYTENIMLDSDSGSFRDPNNKVYYYKKRVIRGVSEEAKRNWENISTQPFFKALLEKGSVIPTRKITEEDQTRSAILSKGWKEALEHERIPFISYPYEWPFSMLKDAALLQLKLVRDCVENEWTLKDATAYNIQWHKAKPVFIDTVSFEPRAANSAWVGYRQFCMMYLYPLMLKAHLDIDYLPILRSSLDGINPIEMAKIFRISQMFKKGVLPHVIFPAKMEDRISKTERDQKPVKKRAVKNTQNMVLGLIAGLESVVRKLDVNIQHTDWSQYENTHSYADQEFIKKKAFVEKCVLAREWDMAWDIGSNTGTFSKICSPSCNSVISIDGDHDAIEQLYRREKINTESNILPLVMNLSNISPDQGWGGSERKSLENRGTPDIVICLALIHHIALSANVPIKMFMAWLRKLNSAVILEYVDRSDAMVEKLLANKSETYPDYNLESFEHCAKEMFDIKDTMLLKNGSRKIFYLTPK